MGAPRRRGARRPVHDEAAAEGGPIVHAGFGQGPNLLWSLDRERIEEAEDGQALLRLLGGTRGALFAEEDWWQRTQEALGTSFPGTVTWRGTVGHKRFVVVASRP